MKRSLFNYFFLGLICLLTACSPESSQTSTNSNATAVDSTESMTVDSEQLEDGKDQETMSRGLEGIASMRMAGFNFQEKFPLLYVLLKDNPDDLEIISSYAQKIVAKEGLNTEQDILDLFDQRTEQIIPILSPYLENVDSEKWYQSFESYEEELNIIGLTQITAEGMYVDLGPARVLTDVLRTNVSNGLKVYADFCNYESLARGGEYPYSNMKPYFDMLLAGEKLMQDQNARIFYDKVDEEFKRALRVITDVHIIDGGNFSPVLVGGINTEEYPYMTELDSHKDFVQNNPDSRYAGVVGRILENTSIITRDPENIYLIVTEWAASLNDAEDKVFDNISNQKDIPHFLEITRANGKEEYAITYRFYEDEETANLQLEACRNAGIDANLLFVSVRNGKLYQIGI